MLRRIYAVIIGAALAVLACEVTLRLLLPPPQEFDVWWPHMHRVVRPDPALVAGVSGEKHFRVSSIGLRGDEPPADSVLRVVAVGGSTTECLYLDQAEAWPEAAARLVARRTGESVWAGNAGKSGLSTRDHVVQMECLKPLFFALEVDAVVFLVGVNDLTQRLGMGERYGAGALHQPGVREQVLRRVFQRLPLGEDPRVPLWKRSALYDTAARLLRARRSAATFLDDTGAVLEVWRERRAEAPRLLDDLPDLTDALAEYRRNLNAMIDVCDSLDTRAILMTQPALWRADLSPSEKRRLWFGGVGDFMSTDGCDYYPAELLREGLDRYNEVTRGVAFERGAEFVDLAAIVAAEPGNFYDDVHFSERGSARVAAVLAEHLLGLPPFSVAIAGGKPFPR